MIDGKEKERDSDSDRERERERVRGAAKGKRVRVGTVEQGRQRGNRDWTEGPRTASRMEQ
jgi:hypothetical protein